MSHAFQGIYPMIYTFFDAAGRIDRPAMKKQLDACVAGGVQGIAILGIVSEFNKLDVNERRQLIGVDRRRPGRTAFPSGHHHIPAPDCADVMARVFDMMTAGDPDQVEEAERLHAGLLPLLTYIMASPEHMLCYGKRMSAQRIGLGEVHPRHPCIMPSGFGLEIIRRYAHHLAALPAPSSLSP